MSLKLKSLSHQTIVITGASSGIGLATALFAARKKAKLVLASRNEKVLKDIVDHISAFHPHVVSIVADVANEQDVQKIVDLAIDEYGGFDTWVNNAGVGLIGGILDVPLEDFKQLFETNFWGVVNGSRAAFRHLRNKGGAIINLGSELSDIAFPLQGMYSASKHAVKGFTDALRIELMTENAPVSVTLIKPAAIGTPFFEHAKNYTDKSAKAPPPVYKAEEVARAILYAAHRPARDIYIGSASRGISLTRSLAPHFADWLGKIMLPSQLSDEPNMQSSDNLYAAGQDGSIKGAHVGHPRISLYTRTKIQPFLSAGVAIALIGSGLFVKHTVKTKMNRWINRL